MSRLFVPMFFGLALIGGAASPDAAAAALPAPTILSCDFDDKPLDTIIGTGGAEAHEPVDLNNLDATVRALPFSTPSLEMSDTWGSGAKRVRFQFLDDVEITTGMVEIRLQVQFKVLDFYSIFIRETGSSTESILNLEFADDGEIYYRDIDTNLTTHVGTYTAGDEHAITLLYDLDANVYSLRINGERLLEDESIGAMTRGIGAVLVGISHDANSIGLMSMDNLIVTATDAPTPVEAATWGRVKALWR